MDLDGQIDIGQMKYMDLSYNKISTLDGLEQYTSLETLILDCNRIGDDIEFPHCPSLTTLSLNKNQVQYCRRLFSNMLLSTVEISSCILNLAHLISTDC